MKNFTKIVLVIACISISASVFSQTIGIKAGLNLANLSAKFGGEDMDDLKMRTAFHIGAVAELPVSDLISIQPGLIISSKGSKIDVDGYKSTMSPLYIDIPVDVKVGGELGSAKVYGAVGPYLGIGIAGKMKDEMNGETTEESIKWGSDENEDDWKRMDFGLGIGAGAEFGAIGVGLTYQLGLTNLVPGGDDDNTAKTRNVMVSVTYYLGR